MSFSKRPRKNTPQCYTKPLDSLKNWNNRFFWVDERVFPTVVDWRTNAPKDGMRAAGTYFIEAVRALDTYRTPIQKQPEMLLCLVGISRRYYLGDEMYPTFLHDNDWGGLIRAPNLTKVKVRSRPHAPHKFPLLTLTANRVIKMDDLATATDSSGVPPTIERSSLDFSLEAEASDQGTVASEVPPSGDVPAATAPEPSQVGVAAADPPAATKSRKRGPDGTDANAPPSHCEGIMLILGPQGALMGERALLPYNWAWHLPLPCLKMHLQASVTRIHYFLLILWPALRLLWPKYRSSPGIAAAGDPESENTSSPAEVGSPRDILRQYNVNLARQVAMGSQLRLMFEQEAKLLKKSVSQVTRRDKRIQAQELEIKNLEALLETKANMKKAAEDKSAGQIKELKDMRAWFSDLQVKENLRKGQNWIKNGQKREACRSREKSEAVTVDRARKTEQNAKRMAENANTCKSYSKFKRKKKGKGLKVELDGANLLIQRDPAQRRKTPLVLSWERIPRLDSGVASLKEQISGEEKLKAAFEEFKRYEDDRVERRCAELDGLLNSLSIDFDEDLYPHMLTAIAGRRWVIGHGLHLVAMKCGESLDMRQAFADVVSTGITKGMSEGLRHGVEHGQAQRNVEFIEAYDPEAEAKFVAALQSDTGEDAPQCIRDLRPSSSQLTIPVYPEVRDPRNPWACKEQIVLADAIAANISRAEKKKKCRIVCRTHRVGSAHHARSDGIPVSAPTVVPQGLALLLVDAATQTEFDDR
nr:hypothetical protein [Tanacetum cinerariifolium]